MINLTPLRVRWLDHLRKARAEVPWHRMPRPSGDHTGRMAPSRTWHAMRDAGLIEARLFLEHWMIDDEWCFKLTPAGLAALLEAQK